MKAQTAQASQAYVTLSSDIYSYPGHETLTFYYGTKPASAPTGGEVWSIDPDHFEQVYKDCVSRIGTVRFDKSFASVKMKSCAKMFDSCEALKSISGLENLNTENVTSMMGMFRGCKQLQVLDLSSFNTASLDTTVIMFANCTNLQTIYACSSFTTDKISKETSARMFYGNTNLVGTSSSTGKKIEYSNGNSNDVDFANYYTGYFTQKPEAYAVLGSSTSFLGEKLTFYYGLRPASANENETIYSIYPKNFKATWNSSADNAAAIQEASFDKSFAQVKLESCNGMFRGCGNLRYINGIENLNTENVKDMAAMFAACRQLQNIDVSKFNTSKVETMEAMFSNCLKLQTLDLSNFNTSSLENTNIMFEGCINLKTIYAGDDFVVDNIKDDMAMFNENDKLVGAAKYSEHKTQGKSYANYKTGYFSYYTIGGEKHPIAGDPLKTDSLDLVDGKDFETSKMFDAENATYSRNVSHKWSTLCLPYAFDAKDNATAYFYEIKNLTDDVLYVTRIDGTVEAGVPVIAYKKANNDKIEINVIDAQVAATPANSTDKDYNLVGSFVEQTVPANAYIIGNDCFWLSSELTAADKGGATAVKTKGFRAYILPKGSNAAGSRLMIGFSDNVTAVDALNKAEEGITECYDVMGRRLSAPQKGINIIKIGNKTKKVIIK